MQYEDLKQDFEDHFAEKENIVATRHRFLNLEQQKEEEVDRFIERVERAGKICKFRGLQDDMVIQVVIKGMANEKIRRELLGKKDLDIGRMKSICNRHEAAINASKIISKESVIKPEIDRIEGQEEDHLSIDRVGGARGGYSTRYASFRGRPGPRRRGGNTREKTCFTCGRPGHFSRECEKGKGDKNAPKGGCFKCGGPHFARDCTKTQGTSNRPAIINAVSAPSSDSDSSL
jgi:hypothetical protein